MADDQYARTLAWVKGILDTGPVPDRIRVSIEKRTGSDYPMRFVKDIEARLRELRAVPSRGEFTAQFAYLAADAIAIAAALQEQIDTAEEHKAPLPVWYVESIESTRMDGTQDILWGVKNRVTGATHHTAWYDFTPAANQAAVLNEKEGAS